MSSDSLAAARAGDRTALIALLKAHDATVRQAVESNLPKRWRSELSVDDVLQVTDTDAFLTIAQCRATDENGFAAWLTHVALNNLRDAVRSLEAEKRGGGARRILAPTDATQSLLDELLGGDSRTPSQAAMQVEAAEALQRAMRQLPEQHRLAVQRYDLDGQPIEVVAAELSRSPGAVHLLRNRAHRRLRELLTAQHCGRR